jgi:anti-anti-sigma factor
LDSPVDQASVALSGKVALVRVTGRGSFKLGASLKQFGESVVRLRVPLLLFDMAQCIGMDSTFMGVLAGLATRLRTHDGRIVLVHCSPRTRGLLATLGLDQLIAAYETADTPPEFEEALSGRATGESLASAGGQDVDTVKTMLDAHQNLVDLVPENLPQFKDVLVYLREEVERKTGEPRGGG